MLNQCIERKSHHMKYFILNQSTMIMCTESISAYIIRGVSDETWYTMYELAQSHIWRIKCESFLILTNTRKRAHAINNTTTLMWVHLEVVTHGGKHLAPTWANGLLWKSVWKLHNLMQTCDLHRYNLAKASARENPPPQEEKDYFTWNQHFLRLRMKMNKGNYSNDIKSTEKFKQAM